jgi:hypothetical protein
MKPITDFDIYADQVLGPILAELRPHQQLMVLVLIQQMSLPVGQRWLDRKIRATGYIRDPKTAPWN